MLLVLKVDVVVDVDVVVLLPSYVVVVVSSLLLLLLHTAASSTVAVVVDVNDDVGCRCLRCYHFSSLP